jgi:hypothetical protein
MNYFTRMERSLPIPDGIPDPWVRSVNPPPGGRLSHCTRRARNWIRGNALRQWIIAWKGAVPHVGPIYGTTARAHSIGGSSSGMDFILEYYFDDSHRGNNSTG